MGRALRYQHNLKIRQPLSEVQLVTRDARQRAVLLEMEDIIREELNVKAVVFKDNEEDLVEYKAKANFRVLGKELGKDMKEGAAIIEQLSGREIAHLLDGAELVIEVAGKSLSLTKDKLDIQRLEKASLRVINEGTLTMALNAEITLELQAEGYVRDLIRGIQTLRKDSGLAVSDRIELATAGSAILQAAFNNYTELIGSETLAVKVEWAEGADMTTIEADAESWRIAIRKA